MVELQTHHECGRDPTAIVTCSYTIKAVDKFVFNAKCCISTEIQYEPVIKDD